MTHRLVTTAPVEVSYFTPTISGNPATNDYCTLTVGNVNQIGITGTGTTTITLPAGQYHARANLGGTKSAASSDLSYQLELDGTLVGNLGGYDTDSGFGFGGRVSTEYSENVFSLSSSGDLRVKITTAVGTNTVTATYSGLLIRRVP
jgi:hypothetical protein